MRRVLIANRGEIALRLLDGAAAVGLEAVAVHAADDEQTTGVALPGTGPAAFLDVAAVVAAAQEAGADAVHPGYGFLSENAEFALAVLEAGLTWIGPPPAAIAKLGDKVAARHIAEKVGAPQVPGTTDPVGSAEEVLAFADEHGLPLAIKAAFGGGGRGIKVVRNRDDIPELYESAVREATAAFGRGDCFDRAIADFAVRYADQTERDYAALVKAVKAGRIVAECGI